MPTCLDQYTYVIISKRVTANKLTSRSRHTHPYVKTLKSGEKVIIDPELSINRIALVFYAFVNVGALMGIPTAYAEKLVGFWLAFLVPGIIYFLLPLLLLATRKKTIRKKPDGSELNKFFMIIATAIKRNKFRLWNKDFWNAAKPSVLALDGVTTWKNQPIPWSDVLVDDVRRTLSACAMFLYFRKFAALLQIAGDKLKLIKLYGT